MDPTPEKNVLQKQFRGRLQYGLQLRRLQYALHRAIYNCG